MNLEKLKELRLKISEWGMKNGITINGKIYIQALKLFSEVTEISEAVLEDDINKFKDGIGDSFVVMVMIADLIQKELNSDIDLRVCNADKEVIVNDKLNKLYVHIGEICDLIAKNRLEDAITEMNTSLKYLNSLAKYVGSDLVECIELAYNEIKDREGFLTPEGTFIKSTDPLYEEIKRNLNK